MLLTFSLPAIVGMMAQAGIWLAVELRHLHRRHQENKETLA